MTLERSISTIFLIALYSPTTHGEGDGSKGKDLSPDALEVTATDEDGADSLDKIRHGVDISGEIRPGGHGPRGCEES